MPMAVSFWAEAFGSVTDRYGIHWLVNGGMKPLG
jgi:PhnB protein